MDNAHTIRERREILAGITVLLFLVLELTFVRTVQKMEQKAAAQASVSGSAEDIVSLYDVQTVSQRLRSLETETQDVVTAGYWGQELKSLMADNPELTYESLQLDDIPLLAVYEDDGQEKPLLLFLHGLGQDKESVASALTAFAKAGYYAVSMDGYDQGSRVLSVSCDTWAAALITVEDIDQVIAYYQTVSQVETKNFVLGGFSMGGVETCAYVQLGSYTPSALLLLSGVCDTQVWQPEALQKLCCSWLKPWGQSVTTAYEKQSLMYEKDKYEAIQSLNISENKSIYKNIPIFCGVGTMDIYFNSREAEQVIKALDNDNASFHSYEGMPHVLTEEIVQDSIAFLSEI